MVTYLEALPKQTHIEIAGKPMPEHGLLLVRDDSGKPAVNVRRVVVDHDAAGFDFGSHRNKDRDLSLNALHAALKATGYKGPVCQCNGSAFWVAFRLQKHFGDRFIFSANPRGEVIPWEEIRVWLVRNGLIDSKK